MPKLDPKTPLGSLYVRFHTNQLTKEQRTKAKAALAGIHYSLRWDVGDCLKEIKRIKDEKQEKDKEYRAQTQTG